MDHATNGQIPHRVFFDAASAAYEDGSPPPKGYRPVKRFEDKASGFKAVVYQNDEGERIYAIAGAEIGRDFAASVRLGEEQFGSRPFGEMIEDAREYSADSGKTVTFTGHSLGGDLASALRRVGADVVRAAGRDGLPPALRDLQRGINLKRDAATALKVDGAFGPVTRTALRRATADLGSAGVERLLALGRFHGFAEDAERDGPADLKDTLEAVSRLREARYGGRRGVADPGRTPARPVGALKRTLNDLGRIHFGGDAWKPLDDGEGRIGPETATASRLREARYGGRRGVAKVLRAAGPKLLTERFGGFLGIL